ncbi:MAG: hypothetical protein NXI23_19785 [Bacteroidetes bacterium]|jgi:hypothetical protein|nr:hypothetical protein [Bacteroidota bacterium]
MKKHLLLNALFIFFSCIASTQVPQSICYQAAAKDPTGADIASQMINVRATVIKNTVNGVPEWQETHLVTTDIFGLFTINIGQGTYVAGNQSDFKDIEWGTGTFWLRIELDVSGGQNFMLMGTSQILSVPYALYADGANNAVHAQLADDATNAVQAQLADQATTAGMADTALVALSVIGDDDPSPVNEIQTLEYQNGILSLIAPDGSSSGSVDIPIDADPNPNNEIQSLIYQNDSLTLLAPNGTPTGASVYMPEDYDTDPSNEIQELELSSDGILSITGGTNTFNIAGGSLNAPGSSTDFPLGIGGKHVVLTSGQYQVPNNKTLWITAGGPTVKLLNIGPAPFTLHPTTPNMPVLDQKVVVENCMCTGILIDTTFAIEPVILDFITEINTYTVPDGKVLFIKSGLKNDQIGRLKVNGEDMEFLRPSFTRGTRIISFPEDTTIQAIPNAFGNIDILLTGYLLKESALLFDPNGN